MRADTADAPELNDRGQGASFSYDAFLSYNHADGLVAAGIQKGLHRIGRRMGQLNALRVFRDSTDLAANPDLWGKVTDALDGPPGRTGLAPCRSPEYAVPVVPSRHGRQVTRIQKSYGSSGLFASQAVSDQTTT